MLKTKTEMRTEIYFAHKVLILTDTPVEFDDYYRMPSSELSRANVLKIFETANTIVVLDSMIELYRERFMAEFKYVEAAGGLVENERDETLMIYCYRHWDLPKGHIDEGESAEECAVREIAEETGVEGAKIVRFLCNTLHTHPLRCRGRPLGIKSPRFLHRSGIGFSHPLRCRGRPCTIKQKKMRSSKLGASFLFYGAERVGFKPTVH